MRAAGHIHAYERTFPVNNYAVDPCGVRYLTMGDGGNIEGLYKTFAGQAGTCTCAAVNNALTSNGCPCQGVAPSTIPSRCHTFQGTPPLFAPVNAAQPNYSAYREPSFGHGILEILDETNAQWTWCAVCPCDSAEPPHDDTCLLPRMQALRPGRRGCALGRRAAQGVGVGKPENPSPVS